MSSGPAHRVCSAVEVFGFPEGHLGHLSEEQEEALREFKEKTKEQGLYDGPHGDQFGVYDDAQLLRFLRARRFNADDAIQQFKATEDWRASNQIETLYNTIDLHQYDETRRLYPQWTGRRDRRGIPVYIFEVAHLNSKTMSAYEKSAKDTKSAATSGTTDPKLLRLFALYENLTRFVMPLSTVLTDRDFPATPITQSNNIVDISNVGLKQFWNLRTHMQNASQLATANYPETLDRIFIIGAPSFFPTVWGWIKRWFDPITTSKIFILSQAEMKSTLESFIEPANIPQKYGGELDFQWGDLPKYDAAALNEVIEWKNGHKDFPEGPMFWHDKGSYIELEACGSVDGKPRSEIVCTVRKTATEKEAEFEKRDQEDLALGRPPTRTGRSQGASLLKIPTLDDAANRKQAEDDAAGVKRPELETFYTAQEDLPTVNVQNSEGGAEGAKVDADAGAQRPLINSNPSQVSTIKEDLSGEHDQTHSAVVPGKEGRRHSVGSHKSIKSHKSFGSRKSQEVSKLGKMMNKLHFKKSPEEQ